MLLIEHLGYTSVFIFFAWLVCYAFNRKFKRSVLYYILIGVFIAQLIDIDHLDGKSASLLLQCALITSRSDPLLSVCNITFVRGIFHSITVFYAIVLVLLILMFLIRKEKYKSFVLGLILGYVSHMILDGLI
jgi:membrane-bound metal-dependent hydrolase YbcI (DUF457 family)